MNINAISGGYVIPKGFLIAKFPGNDYFEELGDLDSLELSVEVERDERDDNRFGVARTADSQVTSVGVSLSFTLMQHTARNRSLGVMGSLGYMQQTAGTALKKTFADVKANQLYSLGKFDVSNVVVTDGDELDPVTYVAGTDYLFDAKTGVVQPLADFASLEVTFDCAVIAETSKRLKTGIGGNPDIEAEVIIVGNNIKGEKVHVHLWKVRLTPSGARGYIGTERAGIEIEGQCLADAAKALAAGDAEEFAFGIEQTLAA